MIKIKDGKWVHYFPREYPLPCLSQHATCSTFSSNTTSKHFSTLATSKKHTQNLNKTLDDTRNADTSSSVTAVHVFKKRKSENTDDLTDTGAPNAKKYKFVTVDPPCSEKTTMVKNKRNMLLLQTNISLPKHTQRAPQNYRNMEISDIPLLLLPRTAYSDVRNTKP